MFRVWAHAMMKQVRALTHYTNPPEVDSQNSWSKVRMFSGKLLSSPHVCAHVCFTVHMPVLIHAEHILIHGHHVCTHTPIKIFFQVIKNVVWCVYMFTWVCAWCTCRGVCPCSMWGTEVTSLVSLRCFLFYILRARFSPDLELSKAGSLAGQ